MEDLFLIHPACQGDFHDWTLDHQAEHGKHWDAWWIQGLEIGVDLPVDSPHYH